MRDYMRRRRLDLPTQPLFERARKRAVSRRLDFSITREDIVIPATCPVLGITLTIGGKRSASSPSLDRIDPSVGYVAGNVRVISDRANRLKGNRRLNDLRRLSVEGDPSLRFEYARVADYVEREELLKAIKSRDGRARAGDLRQLLPVLDRIFSVGLGSVRTVVE